MTTCPWVKLPSFFERPDRLNEWTRATRALAYNYTRHSQDDLLFSIEEYKKSLVVVSIDLKIKAFWKASFTLQTINLFLVRWKPWFFLRRFHLSDPPKLRRACLQSSSSSRYFWAIVFKILHRSDSNQAFLWLKISRKTGVPTNGDSSTDLTE